MKRILSALLAMIIALTACAILGSCGDDSGDDEVNNSDVKKTNYTVTVVDEEGNPIKGANVTFTTATGADIPFPTDKDGKAYYTASAIPKVTVNDIPVGYTYDKLGVKQSFDKDGKLTITLTAIPPLVIYVVDRDHNPVAGVMVQMCDESGSCRAPRPTDEDGRAEYKYEEGEFHASLNGGLAALPEGYTVENPDQEYSFMDGVVTIIIEKIEE